MNSTLWTADRNTHLKILALAGVAAAVLVGVGFAARRVDSNAAVAAARVTGPVLKASKSSPLAASNAATFR